MTLPLFLLKQNLDKNEWDSVRQEFALASSDHGYNKLFAYLTEHSIRELSVEHCLEVQKRGLEEFLVHFPEASDTPLAKIGELFVSRLPTPCG